ncbi:immunoglobulin superfamily member 3-like [Solea solea]|uniref:immunoglobulin superfamily member 3-like n=1 Tax=Solea solea TaxID=90069 RepID=UPI00272CF66C|nr:immunoglobulin superfamily member 3-like [Solea solea]
MRHYMLSFHWSSLLFCLGLLLHSGKAKVHTEIQAGPLYRVLETPLSISCNVSGFTSTETEKEFQFIITKPDRPQLAINIISTHDQNFAYSMYNRRVRSGDITLRHASPNSVVFEIQSLQKGDEGDYECFVVNSESVYNGVYNAKTTVKVIDNSLSVSSSVSTSLSYNEGDALTLTCQASSNTIQHTHLSFAWYLLKDVEEDAKPIISLDRDFTLSPGQGFEERYHAGHIRLDKTGEATYKLTMTQLEVSDRGKIFCQAQEWIQDPDRSWYTITQKDAEKTTLNVKAREVMPDTASLVVRISAQQTTLQEGQELSLSCNVDTANLEERLLTVAWLQGSVEVARIGPTGVRSVGPEYSGREREGELRAARIEDRHYRLILQPVRTEDQGEYFCQAWHRDKGQDGAFIQGAVQKSGPQRIIISATESGLSVEMQPLVNIIEGDRLKLTCKVHGVKGQLSVTWHHRSTTSTATALLRDVIGLSREGVSETEGEFLSRGVKATRPALDTFSLELDEVTPTDSGVYRCTVSEWKSNSKIYSQSQTTTVTVTPIDSSVSVRLISRKSSVTVGENVELLCRVKGPRVPVTLIWSLRRDASTVDNILTLYYDGGISWSGDQQRYQVKVENKPNEVLHYLLINGASHREAGMYQCRASVFVKNVHKKLPESNQVAVMVQNPVSKLILTSPGTLTSDINGDIEIKCSLRADPLTFPRYAVTWLRHHQAENKTIISSNREALITFGTQVEPSSRQRISMRRTEGPSFELTVRQAQLSDDGSYICEVVEWLQDPRGNWFQLSPVSQITEVKVVEPANDLQLDVKEHQQFITTEGDEVVLQCHIISGALSPSFFYKVAWLYSGNGSPSTNVPLVELDHNGLLRYPENQALVGLQGRLHLYRPTQSSFYLKIQRAHEADSGTFQCQVDQYQLDRDGHWQQKASDKAGPITLAVNVVEKNLFIVMDEVEQNVSRSQHFTVPCHISNQSSSESKFQVTWLWQRDSETEQRPIFTAYRNATLQDRFDNGDQLRFGHRLPNQFSLTVTKPAPENSGRYSCEVEEWLLSLSRGWRKVAVEKSGYMTVHVFPGGQSEPQFSSTWIEIFVPLVICLLLVIFLLVLKICMNKVSGGKKPGQSLWLEDHPLNTKPSADE